MHAALQSILKLCVGKGRPIHKLNVAYMIPYNMYPVHVCMCSMIKKALVLVTSLTKWVINLHPVGFSVFLAGDLSHSVGRVESCPPTSNWCILIITKQWYSRVRERERCKRVKGITMVNNPTSSWMTISLHSFSPSLPPSLSLLPCTCTSLTLTQSGFLFLAHHPLHCSYCEDSYCTKRYTYKLNVMATWYLHKNNSAIIAKNFHWTKFVPIPATRMYICITEIFSGINSANVAKVPTIFSI